MHHRIEASKVREQSLLKKSSCLRSDTLKELIHLHEENVKRQQRLLKYITQTDLTDLVRSQ